MKCDICKKNEAVIHIKQTRGNQTSDLNLCAECAAERGIDQKNPQLEKVLDTIFRAVGSVKERPGAVPEQAVYCPKCGTSLGQLMKKETAGCPQFYITFEKELNDSHFHDKIYKGRIPQTMEICRIALQEIPDLEIRLKAAVESENYTEAHRLKNEIEHKKEALHRESFHGHDTRP